MSASRLLRSLAATAVLATLAFQVGDVGPGRMGVSAAQAASARVSLSLFFSSLQPYGAWVRNANYNYVWVPTSVDPNWSPYTNGRWVYTDRYGWYFQSNEPFAWIVYHYGRWGYDPNIGWFWVPGTRWAPAWVAWRRDDRNVGWAPLPPEGRGYAVEINITINIGDVPQPYWRFVRADQFLDPDLHTVVVTGDRDPDLFRRSRPVGSVVVQNNVIINNVINLTFIEQETKKKVEVQTVKETSDPKQLQTQGTPGAITALVADVEQPTAATKPDKVVEEKQVQATKPPTSGQQTPPPANQGAAPTTAQPATTANPPKACPDGSAPLADGTCAAPAAAAPAAKQPATNANPPKACPDGSAPLADGTCAAPAAAAPAAKQPATNAKPPKACPDGSAPLADGTCAAPAAAAPAAKQPATNANPPKACPDGSAPLADGTCAAPAAAAPAAKQPATNANPPKACPDGSAPLADGTCAAPAAAAPAAKQPATNAKPPKACPDGSAPLADGTCAAPAQ